MRFSWPKSMGAYVATTVSDQGYGLVRLLGANQIINYRKDQFEQLLEGYDAVLDTLGGDVLQKSIQILKPGGKIVSVSGLPNAQFGKEAGLGWLKTMLLSIVSRKLTALEKKTQVSYRFLFMKPSGADDAPPSAAEPRCLAKQPAATCDSGYTSGGTGQAGTRRT